MTVDEDLIAAIREFQEKLPGWWFTLGQCGVSRDASCGPDYSQDTPDRDLLKCRMFDRGFHADLPGPAQTMADALREVMSMGIEEKEMAKTDGRTCGDDCGCAAMEEVRRRRERLAYGGTAHEKNKP